MNKIGVLNDKWWLYEPDEKGYPQISNLDENEIIRRKSLAQTLKLRVAGDLKRSTPGDEKWKKAIKKYWKPLIVNTLQLNN